MSRQATPEDFTEITQLPDFSEDSSSQYWLPPPPTPPDFLMYTMPPEKPSLPESATTKERIAYDIALKRYERSLQAFDEEAKDIEEGNRQLAAGFLAERREWLRIRRGIRRLQFSEVDVAFGMLKEARERLDAELAKLEENPPKDEAEALEMVVQQNALEEEYEGLVLRFSNELAKDSAKRAAKEAARISAGSRPPNSRVTFSEMFAESSNQRRIGVTPGAEVVEDNGGECLYLCLILLISEQICVILVKTVRSAGCPWKGASASAFIRRVEFVARLARITRSNVPSTRNISLRARARARARRKAQRLIEVDSPS
jgi:hypothetical protein